MEDERWRVIKDFPDYAVSNLGQIKRLTPGRKTRPGKILKGAIKPPGYPMVNLRKQGKTYYRRVHSLVAQAFIETNHEDLTVNHKDGNKINNHLSNLEYLSQADNNRHAQSLGLRPSGSKCSWARLNESDVKEILSLSTHGMSQGKIGKKFGVNQSSVSLIVRGKMWKSITAGCPDHAGCPAWG